MGQVMAVCISEKKGTQKKGISEGHLKIMHMREIGTAR